MRVSCISVSCFALCSLASGYSSSDLSPRDAALPARSPPRSPLHLPHFRPSSLPPFVVPVDGPSILEVLSPSLPSPPSARYSSGLSTSLQSPSSLLLGLIGNESNRAFQAFEAFEWLIRVSQIHKFLPCHSSCSPPIQFNDGKRMSRVVESFSAMSCTLVGKTN